MKGKNMNYLKIYNSLIHKRKIIQPLIKNPNMITELHHIIPRSISFDDSKSNLVRLTSKEHFICHLLLVKIYENDPVNYNKMLAAIHCVSYFDGKYNKINSRIYCKLRLKINKLMKDIAKRPRKRRRSKQEMAEYRNSKNNMKSIIECQYCSKKFNSNNAVRNHERYCKNNPNRKDSPFVSYNTIVDNNGNKIKRPAWNKGLTKNTDERILKFSNILQQNYKNGKIINWLKGKKHTEEHKKLLSKVMKKEYRILKHKSNDILL